MRFIDRGGMGEVYEVEDGELGERVALKILAGDGDAESWDRLRSEVGLARQVTHRNVCRVFDVVRHEVREGAGRSRALLGLTMELLQGETLEARLARTGAMTPAQVLPIVEGVVAGLAAAHDAGIVHRDLKPANVLLVPAGERERVVVTDFGLAHAVGGDAPSLSGSTPVAGTLGYAAPEQLETGEATPASDIYALGMLMYEMVAGRRPFDGGSPISNAVRRLHETPPSPRRTARGLPRRWERAILRCLEAEPERRFQRVDAVLGALSRRRDTRVWWRSAAVAVVAMATIAAALVFLRPSDRTDSRRPSVAVMGFRNLSADGDLGWLSSALGEMLRSELAVTERLRTVPGETVSRVRLELGLPETDSFAVETLARLRHLLAADYVISGSYVAGVGSRLRVDLTLQEAATGTTLGSLSDTRSIDELLELVHDLGIALRRSLGADALDMSATRQLHASLPATAETARLYAIGLESLRAFDALSARDRFLKAVAADPTYPMAHAALASAWSRLGYDGRARESIRHAHELSHDLPRSERLLVEGQLRQLTGEWDRALEIYHDLVASFPDSADHGLRLASAQVEAGRAVDALATLGRLHRLPPPQGEDPRIDLAVASAAGVLGDYDRQIEAAQRAVAKGRRHGASLLVAEARLEEGWAWWRRGDPEKARAAVEEAHSIYDAAEVRAGVAECLLRLATLHAGQGSHGEATRLLSSAAEIFDAIGDRDGAALVLSSQADLLSAREQYADATRAYWQAHAIFTELGDVSGIGLTLNNLAIVRWEQGDLDGSLELYEESLKISKRIGDASGVATCLNNIAVVLHDRGELAAARERYEEALAISRQIGEPSGIATALNNLGELLREEGRLEDALHRYEESLDLRQQTGDLDGVETALFNIGELLREHGDTARALDYYGRSLELCRRLERGAALSLSRRALVHLDRAEVDAADEAASQSLEIARRSGARSDLAAVLTARGTIVGVAGDIPGGRAALEEAISVFSEHDDAVGMAGAHLALAQLLHNAERDAEARNHARQAASLYRRRLLSDGDARASALLAACCTAPTGSREAADALAEALDVARQSESLVTRSEVLFAAAKLEPHANDIVAQLERTISALDAFGHRRLAIEGRLALAAVWASRGEPRTSRTLLTSVENEARGAGLGLLARRARRLIEPMVEEG